MERKGGNEGLSHNGINIEEGRRRLGAAALIWMAWHRPARRGRAAALSRPCAHQPRTLIHHHGRARERSTPPITFPALDGGQYWTVTVVRRRQNAQSGDDPPCSWRVVSALSSLVSSLYGVHALQDRTAPPSKGRQFCPHRQYCPVHHINHSLHQTDHRKSPVQSSTGPDGTVLDHTGQYWTQSLPPPQSEKRSTPSICGGARSCT
jgi:hypothetical protein